jgi:hypothetical protein
MNRFDSEEKVTAHILEGQASLIRIAISKKRQFLEQYDTAEKQKKNPHFESMLVGVNLAIDAAMAAHAETKKAYGVN